MFSLQHKNLLVIAVNDVPDCYLDLILKRCLSSENETLWIFSTVPTKYILVLMVSVPLVRWQTRLLARRARCNAEAPPSSIPSSLITWLRRVIILGKKEVTETAIARTISHSKWKSRALEAVEGATVMHAPRPLSAVSDADRIVVGKLVAWRHYAHLYPKLLV